jgi:hypothetical protein
MKTGVPGVWEEVARRIKDQTVAERDNADHAKSGLKKPITVRKAVQPTITRERVKRQTARASGK